MGHFARNIRKQTCCWKYVDELAHEKVHQQNTVVKTFPHSIDQHLRITADMLPEKLGHIANIQTRFDQQCHLLQKSTNTISLLVHMP